MIVYVLMRGPYDEYSLHSVHTTLESAKAVIPDRSWIKNGATRWICNFPENVYDYAEITAKAVVE